MKLSPDCKVLAYGVDSTGQERNTVYFMDMDTKSFLNDQIDSVYEDFEFSHDGDCVYYTILDGSERAFQLKRHVLGQDVQIDQVLFHEEDDMFFLSLKKTNDEKFVILKSTAQITSESHYISTIDSASKPILLIPRKENINYTCEHHDSYWYFLTNEDAKNCWLFRLPSIESLSTQPTELEWLELRETVIEHRDFVLVEGVYLIIIIDFQFRINHLIVLERSNCRQNIRIIDLKDAKDSDFSQYHYVGFSEVVYSVWLGSIHYETTYLRRHHYDTQNVRFTYSSFLQPTQFIDYDMSTRVMTIIHEEKVAGLPYDQKLYTSKRLFATGHDGTAIPVSIVYRRDLLGMNMNPEQHNPVLLHAYGAYGTCVNPIFSTSRLSLLNRGFVYAVAHVRGGADMGNGWYEEGKLGKKTNTFSDFCSVAEFLISEGYTIPKKLAIYGRSAGGLLIGAVINKAPHLFQAALTEVPFVDVINTMFDASIPWTAFEWEVFSNLYIGMGEPQ